MAEVWLSAEEIVKLQERLEYLKTTRRAEIAESLKVARSFGDLSENAKYDAAKNEQAKNEYDILQLETELREAKIIDSDKLDNEYVSVGSTVTWTDLGTKQKMCFQIVGSMEANPSQGRIANDSPIGKALLGHKKGETVQAVTPGGIHKLKITAIGK